MKAKLNLSQIIGRLGRDPDMRYTQTGFAIANFSAATDDGYYNNKKKEWVDKTTWHNVTAMGDLAEWVAKNLRKGFLVYVSGATNVDEWTDSQGVKKYKTFIKASTVHIVDLGEVEEKPSAGGGYPQSQSTADNSRANPVPQPDDDIPF